MTASDIRQQLIAKLDSLSDEEMKALLRYIEAMQSTSLPDDYDEAHDPSIGFLSGTTDLATRTKEILQNEISSSGWTQKKD
jgi:hypothetical protein